MEKSLIENPHTPVKHYNYSYIKDILEQDYGQKVSLPTIIDRARRNHCYLPRAKRKVHDREVLTNYPGELVQHDSSHHQFSPYAAGKWYLITSLDDFSRLILYAVLVEKETSWEHILALEYVLLNYGIPLSYYVDSHSVFRFVEEKDSYWRNHYRSITPPFKSSKNVFFLRAERVVNSYRKISINNLESKVPIISIHG